ncbi:D-alanine-D-alanine ligase [Treponema sp. JC4]|uniref:ATP-binding protein n=1 Tax=Treponema sp. JC4 TaxID=1124982 RepID=UPI00025B0C94|nr:D-alanine--D-alanine ligase [Treponema sp. JC4]EID84382.1 D-alanine-D-alanine ligase [Treponema sp. JC4]
MKIKGIKVICNTLDVSLMSFDKIQTHSFLELNGFPVAKAVYVHHELFWAERNRAELKENPYKESVFFRIKNMNFPVIIKDTSGLSSYGMEVCHTFGQVKNFLNGKKNNGDKIVEEFVKGPQFAMEIWGTPESGYRVFKPFMVSVNQYGITSPKQSVKIGPVGGTEALEEGTCTHEGAFPLAALNTELLRLAKLINVNGICQVDFGWDEENKRWVIFELNPRLSGMSQLQFESQLGCPYGKERPAMSLKFPILEAEVLQKLSSMPFVKHVTQTVNDQAKQNREHGYCEVVLTAENFDQLKENLITLDKEFSAFMEKSFFNTAMKLFERLK